ncbi:quaternary ammonium compound efflux SMR transporter SugE [soil metagenome]
MDWIYLLIAGVFEVAWVMGLKSTEGFTKLWPSVLTLAAMFASVAMLALAVRTIPLGTGYAIWTGIGTLGAVVLGMVYFNESTALLRIACIGLILLGIVGLKMASD